MNVTAFICKHHIAVFKWDTHNKKTPCGLSFPTTVIQVIDQFSENSALRES